MPDHWIVPLLLAGAGAFLVAAAGSEAQGVADLTVSNLSWVPSAPVAGQDVILNATVRNVGQFAATTFKVRFQVNGTTLGADVPVAALTAGGSANVSSSPISPWRAQPGSHTATAIADVENAVAELDEGNNTRSETVAVTAPELVIWDVGKTGSYTIRTVVSWGVQINNTGNATAGSFVVRFAVDGTVLSYRSAGPIPAGSYDSAISDTWRTYPGWHNLTVEIDSNQSVSEWNESNNSYREAFYVPAYDFVVLDLNWSQPAVAGSNITLNATIQNQGDLDFAPPAPLQVCVVFFRNWTEGGGGWLIDEACVSFLPIGATATVTTGNWTVPPGNHTVTARVDNGNGWEEHDESNNALTKPLDATTNQDVDLVVVDIALSPPSPGNGTATNFTASVKNQGNGTANASTLRFLLDSNVNLGNKTVPSLAPGATFAVTSDAWNATPGNHTIRAIADALGQVPESNEANNERSENFTISPMALPDLIVFDITWAPDPPAAGSTANFTAVVANQGNANATTFAVRFRVNGTQLGADKVVTLGLASGMTVSVTSDPWNAAVGNHAVEAIVDPLGIVEESNEANNQRSESVVVPGPPAPDLVVQAFSWVPISPAAEDNVTFTATVKNQGNANATASALRFVLNGTLNLGDKPVPALAPGAMTNVTSNIWAAVQGSHTIRAAADALGVVAESNETNNDLTANVSVAPPPKPDLLVTDIDWSPGVPANGTTVNLTAVVHNSGNLGAGPFTVRFLLDGALLGDRSVAGLAAGSSSAITSHAWTATQGSHTVRSIADAGGAVNESNEGNNERVEQLLVTATPEPDLVVLNVSWSPPLLLGGSNATFSATVRNQGAAASAGFVVGFLLDGGPRSWDASVEGLGAGQQVSVTSGPWTAEAGNHAIRVVADADGQVPEASEANNDATANFTVLPPPPPPVPLPDLVLDDLAAGNTTVAAGDRVTFRATVRNGGNTTANASTLRFLWANATVLGDVPLPRLAPGAHTVIDSPGWNATEGNHTLLAIADVHSQVLESDELNNERSFSFSVSAPGPSPKADLAVANLAWVPDTLRVPLEVVFVATVRNDGTAAAASFTVRFLLDGSILLAEARVAGLASREAVHVSTDPWPATLGGHEILARVDARDQVEEVEEGNNEARRSFEVAAPRSAPVPAWEPSVLAAAGVIAAVALTRRRCWRG